MNVKSITQAVVAKVKADVGILEGEAESLLHPIEARVTEALDQAKTEFDAKLAAVEAQAENDAKDVEDNVRAAVASGAVAIKAAIPGLAADAEKAIDSALAAIVSAAVKSA